MSLKKYFVYILSLKQIITFRKVDSICLSIIIIAISISTIQASNGCPNSKYFFIISS